jgi:hypothetical protein
MIRGRWLPLRGYCSASLCKVQLAHSLPEEGSVGGAFFCVTGLWQWAWQSWVLESSKTREKEVHTRPELLASVQKLSKKTAIAQEKIMSGRSTARNVFVPWHTSCYGTCAQGEETPGPWLDYTRCPYHGAGAASCHPPRTALSLVM